MPALLGVLLCAAGLLAIPGKAFSQVPQGVFSLSKAGTPVAQKVLTMPDVVGISIRQDWSDLEPTEGAFDWTFLDSEVARIAGAGKQVLLRINTQSGKPAWVTAAVANAGGSFFTFDDNGVQTTIPVFWDPTFLAKKKAMIAALGTHFTNNPAVKIVSASFANAKNEDWLVPHTPVDVTNWLAAGYTTQKMLDTGKQIIGATMAAFPNQLVTLSVGSDGNLDPTPTYVASNAVSGARASWPGRLIVQINSLSTFNPAAPGPQGSVWRLLWNSQPNVAGQMLWWCVGDTTYKVNGGVPIDPAIALRESIDAGVSYGMQYIEIYQIDVVNLPTVISYAASIL